MASVARVDLRLEQENFAAGAVFRIPTLDQEPVTVEVSNNATVEIHPRNGVVVAFLKEPVETGYLQAHEAAQRGLDVAAFTASPTTALLRANEEFVQWWRDEGVVIVRPVVTRTVGVSMSANATVTQADGTPRPSPPLPEPMWTRALRFYRYSQLADDVFDAYRNLFLALEAALSEIVTGGPQGEREWLKYALTKLVDEDELDLSHFVPGTQADPVEHFLTEQYSARRCATFHAKTDRDVLTPGSAEDRATVASALGHLSSLVMHLIQKLVGRRGPSGAMTYKGFEGLYIAPKVGKLSMSLARRVGPDAFDGRVQLETEYFGEDSVDRGEFVFGGHTATSELADSSFDALLATAPGGEGLTAGPLDETFDILPIDLAGADRVEALLVFALNNLQQPRSRFAR